MSALPVISSDLRQFLQRLLEPLQGVFLFLVFCVRLLLLQRVLLRLLRDLLALALKITTALNTTHEHSPFG